MLKSNLFYPLPRWASWTLALITAGALVAGLYGRFKGLGTWPLGVDEFYISRSIDNVLRFGLPQFPCGGYYTRGLLYQYAVALLRICGLSSEFAGRLVPAISSLAVLPAAYLLARRVHGRLVGLLVVIILSVSIWEIEMARFARMYAPFQAVFAWYLVFFLRYTLDRSGKALGAMVALSVIGILTWEGGVFIGLINLLPPLINQKNGRLRRTDWAYLAAMAFLLVLLVLATRDLRGFAAPPALPVTTGNDEPQGYVFPLSDFLISVRDGWPWFLLSLLPLGFALAAFRWIGSLRGRWLAACGLSIALLSALLHQFLAAAACLILLLLLGIVDQRELMARGARFFRLSLASAFTIWLLFCAFTGVWAADAASASTLPNKIMAVAHHLLGFPNVLEEIVRPWGRVLPMLAVGLALGLLSLMLRTIVRRERRTALSSLLIALVFVMFAVGATATDRIETRYTFFLYPLALTLALTALASWSADFFANRQRALFLTSAAALVLFGLSEDFQPRHLAQVDNATVTFRIGMPPLVADHYYQRSDTRGAARWLSAHVRANDIVMNSVPNVDAYYHRIDYFFLDADDPRYETYACHGGTEDRWTGRPLLYTMDSLRAHRALGRRLFLILYPSQSQTILTEAKTRGWAGTLAWTSVDRGIDVVMLNP